MLSPAITPDFYSSSPYSIPTQPSDNCKKIVRFPFDIQLEALFVYWKERFDPSIGDFKTRRSTGNNSTDDRPIGI